MKKWGLMLAMGLLPLAACTEPGAAPGGSADGGGETGGGSSTLQTVLDRGSLVCGVDLGIPRII